MVFRFLWIIAAVISISVSFFGKLVDGIEDIWIPIILIPVAFIAVSILYGSYLLLILAPVDYSKQYEQQSRFYRNNMTDVTDYVIHFLRIKLHINGMEKLPESGRFLIVCNHRSFLDPVILANVFADRQISFVSKKENYKLPLVGKLMHRNLCLSLDREDDRAAVKTIRAAAELMKNDKAVVCIYPEGHRNQTEILSQFRHGAFKAAKWGNSPIAVMTLRNSDRVAKRYPLHRTEVYLDIIETIDIDSVKSCTTAELSDRAWTEMYAVLGAHYSEIGRDHETQDQC